ncbi:unnamed protein product [Phyllotreta striolata]|uniref:Uncharacterized protein n=1 Tax=Phyllotreta striolata TaxID=444603 RepID=A0A9N9XJ96_PHYSR|nr:unnamed protein product [Phyllotreta striolata]
MRDIKYIIIPKGTFDPEKISIVKIPSLTQIDGPLIVVPTKRQKILGYNSLKSLTTPEEIYYESPANQQFAPYDFYRKETIQNIPLLNQDPLTLGYLNIPNIINNITHRNKANKANLSKTSEIIQTESSSSISIQIISQGNLQDSNGCECNAITRNVSTQKYLRVSHVACGNSFFKMLSDASCGPDNYASIIARNKTHKSKSTVRFDVSVRCETVPKNPVTDTDETLKRAKLLLKCLNKKRLKEVCCE